MGRKPCSIFTACDMTRFLNSIDEINFLFLVSLTLMIAMITHFAYADVLVYHLPLAVEFSRGRFSFDVVSDDRFYFPANWSLIQAVFFAY